MARIKAVMLSWEFPPRVIGGLATHVHDLSRVLARKGLDIFVVTCDFPGAKPHESINGVEVYRIDSYQIPSPDFPSWALAMNLSMEKEALGIIRSIGGIDIIHAHDWMVGSAAIGLKNVFRKPLIATIHSTEYGRRNGLHTDHERMIHQVEWWLTFEAWRVICCSKYMSTHVQHIFGLPGGKLDVIPNGVFADEFKFDFDRKNFRRDFAHPKEKMVLYVGRLVTEKGINVLIKSFPLILGSVPNTKFVVVGEGGMRVAMEDLAKALGLYGKVYFTGFVDDETLRKLYQCADVCVFPSLYEPFGIVALEAMAAGTPVVVSDIGGFSEIVKRDVTGVKVFPNNPDSLARGIMRILKDPEYAVRLRENARKRIETDYNWDLAAEKTVEIYTRVIEEYRKTGRGKN